MDFGLGLFAGMFIMWAIAMKLKAEWKRNLEKLKDYETLEEAKKYAELSYYGDEVDAFIAGANYQAERMYSEENMILYSDYVLMCSAEKTLKLPLQPKEWYEQFKKK